MKIFNKDRQVDSYVTKKQDMFLLEVFKKETNNK